MSRSSHATRGGWEPKTCQVCGQPVRVSRDTAWFHYTHRLKQGFSFHMHCHTHINWEHTR